MVERTDKSRKRREIVANNLLTSEAFDLNPVERIHLLQNLYSPDTNSIKSQFRSIIDEPCTQQDETGETEEVDGTTLTTGYHRKHKGQKHSRHDR